MAEAAGNEKLPPGKQLRSFGPHFDLRTGTWTMRNREAFVPTEEGSDDSERMAADLNVDDWAGEAVRVPTQHHRMGVTLCTNMCAYQF